MKEDKLMNLNQLTDYIPFTKSTIYSMVSRKQIPFKKIRRRLIFSKNEIDHWINNGGKNDTEFNIPTILI
jgi:excisionase family DNA binding protein